MTCASIAVVSCAVLAIAVGAYLWLRTPPDDGFGGLFDDEEDDDGDR